MTSPTPSGHVLLVDDDPTGIMVCTHHLKRRGFTISSASSVAQARIRLSTEGPAAFAAVVTDYRMPNEDGLTMLLHVQECDPTLAVILLTAEGEKGLVTRSLRGGAHNFLDKPVPGPVLVEAVTAAAAAATGAGLLAVVMTGMGSDGMRGCELVLEQRGHVLAQDEATSVVWGMPGSVVHAGFADQVLPLSKIASEITRRTMLGRPPSP